MANIPVTTAPDMTQPTRQPSATVTMGVFSTATVEPVVGASIDAVRAEIDDAFADMKTFHNREPDDVLRLISGHSARLAELRGRIARVENVARHWLNVRVREVEPALDELQKQYQIASRQLSFRELDWKMETGAR